MSPKRRRSKKTRAGSANDDVLAVLVDERNGREYYVSMIDTLVVDGREYSVMYNYEPDDGSHFSPEIVIMRLYRAANGDLAFSSIINKKELDEVFDHFFRRYEAAKFQ
ncbi:MAG TPA: DUF1292 domain-containing protein [Fastidiosipila sp.]|nr:DUF1292 domain-containing protein [Fastidiosipila sp.]